MTNSECDQDKQHHIAMLHARLEELQKQQELLLQEQARLEEELRRSRGG